MLTRGEEPGGCRWAGFYPRAWWGLVMTPWGSQAWDSAGVAGTSFPWAQDPGSLGWAGEKQEARCDTTKVARPPGQVLGFGQEPGLMWGWVYKWKRETDGHGRQVCVWGRGSNCSVIVDATGSNINPVFSTPPHPACQIVRALEHLHSKLSVIHRGQCPIRPSGRGPRATLTRSLTLSCEADGPLPFFKMSRLRLREVIGRDLPAGVRS